MLATQMIVSKKAAPMMRILILSWLAMAMPLAAQETVRYAVEVSFDWQPGDAVEDPHFSRLIAFSHSSKYSLFRDGDTASSGLALVATNGRVSVLEAELAEARRRGRVGAHIVKPGIHGVGAFTFELSFDDKLAYAAFATMLAPSPDWLSGASGVHMRDALGNWRETMTIPLWVWDAGADSGMDFVAPNAPTQPRQSVRLLTHPAFLRPEGLRPIGEARFQRIND